MNKPNNANGMIYVKKCVVEECVKWAKSGGRCIYHGAKKHLVGHEDNIPPTATENSKSSSSSGVEVGSRCKDSDAFQESSKATNNSTILIKYIDKKRKRNCEAEGCTNGAIQNGVCVRHGARVKRCAAIEGCQKQAQSQKLCIAHGAKVRVRRCRVQNCDRYAVRGGICKFHGAKVQIKRCSSENCPNGAIRQGVCIRHGAEVKVKACTVVGCPNQSVRAGVCISHGAKKHIRRAVTLDNDSSNFRNRNETNDINDPQGNTE